ncbi:MULTISPECIES: Stp1/IreP family PP2C-type Ser/Thr phosphatase [Bacillaceae]|uniref:Stp1/IreP family PP2C-type Ser/Thr phosphatase n=1 Tax=Evansella alkalicola TaxID=745819 RepID=A0ABS6JPA4_9BACI|nr:MULTISPECIES: Stp1/IreP family PP2C-type Ser/Thr phosphatase [Bacillaceae]MBU9720398.1 Stp1/IreP family PP2C-type Ser/Thr phosphatase [Bacillus alkalicola]
MDAVFRTDTGQIRPHNEDDGAFSIDQYGQVLALVADGMGGHQAGDVASKMTKDFLLQKWEDNTTIFSPKEAEEWLTESIQEVNAHLFNHAKENIQCEGMGTTLVVAICNEQFVTVAHVGDSRIYLKTTEGMKQMTADHSLVGELVRSGQITETEAMHHPRKNVILRALGTEESIKVDVNTIDWDPGSYLLLCSDGLTDKLNDQDINEELDKSESLEEIVDRLIEIANERGGEDNVTITLLRHSTQKEVSDE